MKNLYFIFIVIFLVSCFKDDEIYFDSDGNAINYSPDSLIDNGNFNVAFNKVLAFDSSNNISFTGSDYTWEGKVAITVSVDNDDNYLAVLASTGDIIAKELFSPFAFWSGHDPVFDNDENVVMIRADYVSKFNVTGNYIEWEKYVEQMFSQDIAESISQYDYPYEVVVDDDGNYNICLIVQINGSNRWSLAVPKYSPQGSYNCIDYSHDDSFTFEDATSAPNNSTLISSHIGMHHFSNCDEYNSESTSYEEFFVNQSNNAILYKYRTDGQFAINQLDNFGATVGQTIIINKAQGSIDYVYRNLLGEFIILSSVRVPERGNVSNIKMEVFKADGSFRKSNIVEYWGNQIPISMAETSNGTYTIMAKTDGKKVSMIRVKSL